MRTIDSGSCYHVITRGINKMPVFRDEEDYVWYLQTLIRSSEDSGVSLYHYVLMPNHVHLLFGPGSLGLSKFMQSVNSLYAMRFAKKYAWCGHVWQGRFKSLRIRNDAYLLACGNYIEMNPVRARLVAKPEDWSYSSYRYYAYGQPDLVIQQNLLYANLGRDRESRMIKYRKLIGRTRQGQGVRPPGV